MSLAWGVRESVATLFAMQPEYLHALSSHLLVLGIGLGLFATLLACWLRSRAARLVGLSLLFLCSAAAYPTFWLGHEGYRNVRGITDEQGQAWLDMHLERAESVIWLYYLATLFAGCAILLPRSRPGSERLLIVLALASSSLALGAGVWVATAGGRVRHSEFRPAEPLAIEDESETYEVAP